MQARPIGGRRQDIPAPKRKPAVDDRADLISLVSALRTDTSTAKTGGRLRVFRFRFCTRLCYQLMRIAHAEGSAAIAAFGKHSRSGTRFLQVRSYTR
jgi:hypothetical protein